MLHVKCLNSYLWDDIPICGVKSKKSNSTLDRFISTVKSVIFKSSTHNHSNKSRIANNCYNDFPTPLHHNKSSTHYHLNINEKYGIVVKPGSRITFKCLHGFNAIGSNHSLTTNCLPTGNWTSVSNCKSI